MEDQESRPELRSPRRTLGREIEPCGERSNLAGIGPETSEVSANELREYGRTSPLAGGGHVRRETGPLRGLAWILAGGATYEV